MAERSVGAFRTDSAREAIADRLHDAAGTIRERATAGSEALTAGAERVASGLEASASYVQSHDARGIVQDLVAVIKRHPAQSLLLAGFVGFMVARAFRSD